eukprot:3704608-Heterocapsa_arctica.AAC.1
MIVAVPMRKARPQHCRSVRVDDQCARRGRSTPSLCSVRKARLGCGSKINAQGAAAAPGHRSSAQGAAGVRVDDQCAKRGRLRVNVQVRKERLQC